MAYLNANLIAIAQGNKFPSRVELWRIGDDAYHDTVLLAIKREAVKLDQSEVFSCLFEGSVR